MKNNQKLVNFLLAWFGETISMVGTRMTRFALIIWIYQATGSAFAMALLGVFSFGSSVLISPIAGYWVDKLDRRRVMIWADLGAGFATVGIFAWMLTGNLEVWHLYILTTIAGIGDAFYDAAWDASISTLIPKQHLARANSLNSLSMGIRDVFAPIFAGFLYATAGLTVVMLFDIISFIIGVLILMLVRFPKINTFDENEASETFWQKLTFGFRYIAQRQGLLALLIVMSLINFMAALTYYGIFSAMVLARTGGDERALASVQSALGIGAIVGSVVMTVWGGPKKRIHGVLLFTGLSVLTGDLLFGISSDVRVWIFAGITTAAFIPFITASNLAIWQVKVPQRYQGRVLVVQRAIRLGMNPIGFILGGLAADYLFEPAMMPDGVLAPIFGWLVGTGAGAGMGLMFVITWALGMVIAFGGYFFAPLRNVERDLPDYDSIEVTT